MSAASVAMFKFGGFWISQHVTHVCMFVCMYVRGSIVFYVPKQGVDLRYPNFVLCVSMTISDVGMLTLMSNLLVRMIALYIACFETCLFIKK